MSITVVDRLDDQKRLEIHNVLHTATVIAVDAEGVDLSRHGKVCIIQMGVPGKCFVFDVLNEPRGSEKMEMIKSIIENPSIEKVIHDCRLDADALFHHFGIRFISVHDTSVWHDKLGHGPDVNLNDTLLSNGLPTNTTRNKIDYRTNPNFWATRPMTGKMLTWATNDIDNLIRLRDNQLRGAKDLIKRKAQEASQTNAGYAVNMKTQFITVENPGYFIGRNGVNLRQIQKRTNTLVYGYGNRNNKQFLVYYNNDADLRAVQQST